MGFGKRQLILAALVVALGTAVYLNWQFTGNDDLLATNAVNSEKNIGEAQLVNGSALSSGTESAAGAESGSPASSDYFSQARLSRQKSRDEAKTLLEEALKNSESSDEVKKEALAKAQARAENMLQEDNIENLIKAKGFPDCVVFIQNGECSVVVKRGDNDQNYAIVIKDIVAGQSGITYDKIKIVESE